ncbi:MAG: DUF4351 domain-containing protein, partial [Magnetococcales bacterium]|nr:DUF4351 domain-containing protein [Magnetococcales bacterium]
MLAETVEGWTREWMQQGMQAGKAETLLKQLHRRFGAVPEAVQVKVTSAELGELEVWLDRIFDAD